MVVTKFVRIFVVDNQSKYALSGNVYQKRIKIDKYIHTYMIKKLTITFAMASVAMMLTAQPAAFWNDPRRNNDNREECRSDYFAYENQYFAETFDKTKSSRFISMEGEWKFNWVKNADQRPAGFYTLDYNDKNWDAMQVPGIWEMYGYGDAIYVNTSYAWRNDWKTNPPFVKDLNNHVGSYRRWFDVPADWNGEKVYVHIGSATSNLTLYVNGQYVGYSEDSKTAAEFEISKYLKPGSKNLIAMQIMRWCDGSYLEDQDFWRLCGIARECYMYARPENHVKDVFITPDLTPDYRDGMLTVKTSLAASGRTQKISKLVFQLKDMNGVTVRETSSDVFGTDVQTLITLTDCNKWTAETPYLYRLYVLAYSGDQLVEVIPQKVGFRKIEIKHKQLLVNGQPVLIKGVDRHEMDPDKGYVVSYERMLQDITMLKKLNMNAVRTCHYPDDPRWYDLCDQYGIYMTSESNLESHGMGYGEGTLARREDYHDAHMERQYNHMKTYKNHPAIIVWSLGNEAGYGKNFEDAYDWVKQYDPSRPCQYEQAGQTGKTDIFCPMYYGYEGCEAYAQNDNPRPLIQCEYAHAMGNSIGGFKEYWDIVRKYPAYQGGYIWDFIDQGLHSTSKVTGKMIYAYGGDFGRYPASDNNFNCNGVINPDRIPNPHAYEVQYYYQNIWSKLIDKKTGKVEIYNENFFTPIQGVALYYDVQVEGVSVDGGVIDVTALGIKPLGRKTVKIKAIADAVANKTYSGKEIVCNLSYNLVNGFNNQVNQYALLQAGDQIAHEQFVLTPYKYINIDNVVNAKAENKVQIEDHEVYILLTAGNTQVTFTKHNGRLAHLDVDGIEMMQEGYELRPDFWRAPTDNDFGAGMQRSLRAWKNPQMRLTSFDYKPSGSNYVVTANYEFSIMPNQPRGRRPQQGEQTMPQPQTIKLAMTYTVTAEGKVVVSEDMQVPEEAKNMPQLLRYGMEMQMPQQFDQIQFYGKGPQENYIDRNNFANIGLFNQTVAEQYYGYVRPQESGNKTQVRYWKVLNAAGQGLMFQSNEPMECSTLKYTTDDLDPAPEKAQYHSGDLIERPFSSVHIAQRQMGMGCVNSWGAWPRNEYQMPCKSRKFTFVITPVK